MPKYTSGQKGAIGPLPEGNYPFSVVSARLKNSKKNPETEMIELVLDVGGNGASTRVFDYLIFDGGLYSTARIDQFRTAIGETVLPGEEVNFEASDCLDKTGTAHVIIEEWLGKKRNKIGSYLEPQDEIPDLVPPEPKKKANPLKSNSPF